MGFAVRPADAARHDNASHAVPDRRDRAGRAGRAAGGLGGLWPAPESGACARKNQCQSVSAPFFACAVHGGPVRQAGAHILWARSGVPRRASSVAYPYFCMQSRAAARIPLRRRSAWCCRPTARAWMMPYVRTRRRNSTARRSCRCARCSRACASSTTSLPHSSSFWPVRQQCKRKTWLEI